MQMLFISAASPVHIVGPSHPHISQPPKVLNLFPKGSETKKVVLENMYSLQATEKKAGQLTIAERAGMSRLTHLINSFDFVTLNVA